MLDDNLKKKIKEKLVLLEMELLESIESSEKSAKPVTLDQQSVGRVSRIDAIQQQQMSLNSLGRQKRQLEKVRQALRRINDENFGFCQICEEPINESRLMTRPEHSLCLNCTKQSENKN